MIKTKENQSALNLSTQLLGTLEGLFDYCLLNDISITDDIAANTVHELPQSIKKLPIISDYFSEKEIVLATGYPLIEPLPDGIGEMIIESTFIVT